MEKILFLLLTSLLFIACKNEAPQYQINGKVIGDINGKTVYLRQLEQLRPTTIVDSAVIENNAFIMKGSVAIADVYNLAVDGEKINFNLFVENLPIQVGLEINNSGATGSPLNDLYTQYLNELKVHQAKFQDFRTRLKEARRAQAENILSPDAKRDFTKEEYRLTDESRAYQLKFVNDNPNTIVSAYVFRTIALHLNPAEVESALSKFESPLKESYYIVSIQEDLGRMKLVDIGQKFVDVKMPNAEGVELTLSDYAGKGKYVLIDFWASWCPDCIEENPTLIQLYNKYKDKGFEIVGMSLDRNKEDWVNCIEKGGLKWVQMCDLKVWNSAGAYSYNIKYVPSTILLDRDGIIIAKNLYDVGLADKLSELMD